jgi:hypothetical protein
MHIDRKVISSCPDRSKDRNRRRKVLCSVTSCSFIINLDSMAVTLEFHMIRVSFNSIVDYIYYVSCFRILDIRFIWNKLVTRFATVCYFSLIMCRSGHNINMSHDTIMNCYESQKECMMSQ